MTNPTKTLPRTQLRCNGFEHSDWLRYIQQPIRFQQTRMA